MTLPERAEYQKQAAFAACRDMLAPADRRAWEFSCRSSRGPFNLASTDLLPYSGWQNRNRYRSLR
jgi:hypothetical protein